MDASKLPSRSYRVSTGENKDLAIAIVEERCEAENLHLVTWVAAIVLSDILYKLPIDTAQLHDSTGSGCGYSVLELGAGTGLTGLSAAALWGTGALLTELPTIVPGLEANADLNRETLAARGGRVGCGTLDWNEPGTIHLSPSTATKGNSNKTIDVEQANGFPVVLAADTMYTEYHPELLTAAIAACLRRTAQARAVVSYPMRIAYVDYMRDFWARMDEAGLEAAAEGRVEYDGGDDERLHEWSVWKWKGL